LDAAFVCETAAGNTDNHWRHDMNNMKRRGALPRNSRGHGPAGRLRRGRRRPAALPPVATPLACTDLAGMAIPAASIGLPTTGAAVTTAVVVAPSGSGAAAIPEHCLVDGSISPIDSNAPKILFGWRCRPPGTRRP
jgi:hypothetical protein